MNRPLENLAEHEALKLILEGTSRATGHEFFRALVRTLATALGTHGAWVTELDAAARRLDSFAFWLGGEWVEDYSYDITGTPCEGVIRHCRPVWVPDNVIELYPDDPDLPGADAVSYVGVPLTGSHGQVIGNLAVLDRRPMPEEPRALAIIQIFAARAAAEVERLRADRDRLRHERQLGGLIDSALDAIVQLDDELRIVRANPAAEKTFGAGRADLEGRPFADFLRGESPARFRRYVDVLRSTASAGEADPRSAWIAGGLEASRAGGTPFPAEASLACFESGSDRFVTVILRDVDERLEAERRIESLRHETEALREELQAIEGTGEILGRAPSLREMLRDVAEVAATDATVLIQGETGTGKELVARAIHAASLRRERRLVKLNCGAIPSGLIESELFGHERGAYTGATARRDGRFLLADGGTLFLDEIGELPLDLQVKLLRVLQEGEFEPVGSSRTRKVDVRVVAATNRDLDAAVAEGRFREDLFYRLNVFPVRVPPLRERKEDIPLLAEAFTRRIAAKVGRRIEGLTAEDARRLGASDWPGNVRELQNVIERAVITSRDGRLNLERALPGAAGGAAPGFAAGSATGTAAPATAQPAPGEGARVMTRREMEALERDNLVRALEQSGWKVAGAGGAAARVGLKPSTMTSRMKALGIKRPR